MSDDERNGLLERIHAAPPLMVMNFAGAGSRALWLLHSLGGSSRTVLEAVDRYAPRSLVDAVGFTPQRFTAPEVAAALARASAHRANVLADDGVPVFGLGLTATIATDRLKKGEHRCEVAVEDAFGVSRYGLVLAKGERDRAGEEELISDLVLLAIAEASGVLGCPPPPLHESEELFLELQPTDRVARFERGDSSSLLLSPRGVTGEELPERPVILSGSFNPLHHGHLRLAEAAGRKLGKPVLFELPLLNAEKAEISLEEARRRANQFLGRAPLILTRSALFSEKAELFPGATFVVGVDTAARLLEARFYGSDQQRAAALRNLARREVRFLVAGRTQQGRFRTLADLDVPDGFGDLFDGLDEDEFREDISSTQLRREWREWRQKQE